MMCSITSTVQTRTEITIQSGSKIGGNLHVKAKTKQNNKHQHIVQFSNWYERPAKWQEKSIIDVLDCKLWVSWAALTRNSNSRGCFWWWKRPWTWKSPFRGSNGTPHPTLTLGSQSWADTVMSKIFGKSIKYIYISQFRVWDRTSLLARCSILLQRKSPDPTSTSLGFIEFFIF